MSASETIPNTPVPPAKDPSSRIADVEKAVSTLNTKLTAVAVIGVLLGSGGLIGVVKNAREAKSIDVDTVVTIQKQKIESLERSVKRLEDAGAPKDSNEVAALRKRIEESEAQLRSALQRFDSTTKALATNLEALRESSNEIARTASAAATFKLEIQEEIRSLNRSIQQQSAVIAEVQKDQSASTPREQEKSDF